MHYKMIRDDPAICGCSHVLSRVQNASPAADERQHHFRLRLSCALRLVLFHLAASASCLTPSLGLQPPLTFQRFVVSVSTCHLQVVAAAAPAVVEDSRVRASAAVGVCCW